MFEHDDHPGLRALLSFEATRHHVAMEYREQQHWAGALPPFAPRVEVVAYRGDHQANVQLPVAGGTFPYEGPHLVLHDVPTLRLPQDDESGTPVCGVDGNRVLVFLSLETLFRLAEQVPRDTPDPTTPTVNPAHQVFDAIMSWALPRAIANIQAHDWQAEAADYTRMKMEVLDRSMRDWRDQIARNERDIEEKTWEIRNLVTAAQRLREALEGFQAHTRMQHRRRAAEEHAELVKMLAAGAIRNLRCGDDGIEFECGPVTIDHDDRDFVLGPYRVSVNLPEASFRVTGMPGCPKAEGYVHPHVASSGTPCLGNAGPMLAKTLGTGDVVGGVQTILEFLRSYSDGNGYVNIWRWDPDYDDDDDRYQRCFDNSSCHDCVVCNDYECPWRDGAEGRCWDYHDVRDCIECGDCGYRDTAVENCRSDRCIEGFQGNPYTVSVVVNRKGDVRARIDVFHPVRVVIDDVPVNLRVPDMGLSAHCASEFQAKVVEVPMMPALRTFPMTPWPEDRQMEMFAGSTRGRSFVGMDLDDLEAAVYRGDLTVDEYIELTEGRGFIDPFPDPREVPHDRRA